MSEGLIFNRNYYISFLEKSKKNLPILEHQLKEEKQKGNKYEVKKIMIEIKETMLKINRFENAIHNLREMIPSDIEERKALFNNYAHEISRIIPDSVPLVFHGNKSIGTVETIMKNGGLFIPRERGINYISYATKIDVTNKHNISESLNFAEPGRGNNYYDPYGAIFVFMPKPEEYERVITARGTLVNSGVDSINFREEPDRLIAIITTNENIERLKKVAREAGIDERKITTHEAFLNLCKEKYNSIKR